MDTPQGGTARSEKSQQSQVETPSPTSGPASRNRAVNMLFSLQNTASAEERKAKREELYGNARERSAKSEGAHEARDSGESETDEIAAPAAPTPNEQPQAGSTSAKGKMPGSGRRRAEGEDDRVRAGFKTAKEHLEEERRGRRREENATEERGEKRGRSKKRQRMDSPESQEGEDPWRDDSGPRESRTGERASMAQPTSGGAGGEEAPPQQAALPTAEECEAIVEEVLREATATLRERLWNLVGRVRNQTMPPAKSVAPPPTQESISYWDFFDNPLTAAQPDAKGTTDPQALKAEASRADTHEADIDKFFQSYQMLESATAAQQQIRGSALQGQAKPQDMAEDPRLKPGKGKEREETGRADPMDVDTPFAAMLHATLNDAPPVREWTTERAAASIGSGMADAANATSGTMRTAATAEGKASTVVYPRAAAAYGVQMHASAQAQQVSTRTDAPKVGSNGFTYEDEIQRPPTPDHQELVSPNVSQDGRTKEEAEARYAINLERRLKSAKLTKPIAEVEASGQPEHRRREEAPNRTMAMSLWNERKHEIAKLGLTPPPNELFPAIHANFPSCRVRGVSKQTLTERHREKPGTYILLDVYGAGPIEEEDVRGTSMKLENALRAITGLEKFRLEQPPRMIMGTQKEHAPTTWYASGLYPEAVELLAAIHAWPTAEITFFVYKDLVFIPRYLFAITGFTQNEPNEIRLAVWKLFHQNPIYMATHRLVGMNPDYAGKDTDKATNELLRSIEVQVRPVDNSPSAALITHVYMTSPTRSASVWQSWRDGIRFPGKGVPLSRTEAHLKISGRLTRCKACHGADHLTTQCKWAHYSGWESVTERTGYQQRDPHRERTPRPGPPMRANETGGPARWRDEEDSWTEVGQPARGERSRGPGGPAAMRGYQSRPRRN
ncbi:hypothetical protein OH77DRAFT_1593197 [Trametes cingulata]|nr:hypothetical protein OH77DRAFT_1593197 [Trametes cingulata]